MVVRFNALNRLEKPPMILCNPGTTCDNNGYINGIIGSLIGTEAEELELNFNEVSELSFRIYKTETEDTAKNAILNRTYESIKNRRLMFLDDIGFFVISDVDEKAEGDKRYKDVKAESGEAELKQRMTPFIADGTYPFRTYTHDGVTDTGILDMVIDSLPLWTIGNVDETTAAKFRSFEDVDVNKNCLSFLIDEVQEAYECVILFDTINRKVNVYDQENFIADTDRMTGICLSYDELIKSAEISESADDLYTAIRATGGDDEEVFISWVNPTGDNVIYNFDYYLDWMSSGLRNKLIAWRAAVEDELDDTDERSYISLRTEECELRDEVAECEYELARLNTVLKVYTDCKNNIVATQKADGDYTSTIPATNSSLVELGEDAIETTEEEGGESITKEINELLTEISGYIADVEADIDDTTLELLGAQAELEQCSAAIAVITGKLRLMSDDAPVAYKLTAAEKEELNCYIFEGNYKDDYVLFTDEMTNAEKLAQMQTLYERANRQLERVSRPKTEIKIDAESFVFAKKFAKMSEELETGCVITADLYEGAQKTLFLSGFSLNYDDRKIGITLSDSYNKFDPRTLFEEVLGSVSKSANTINYVKEMILPIRNGDIDEIKQALLDVRNVTMSRTLSSQNQSVSIDATGYTGKKTEANGDVSPEQVKIINNAIVFTSDNWQNCRTALGKISIPDTSDPTQTEEVYGLAAEAIVGDLVLTQELNVVNESGSVNINEDGINIALNGDVSTYVDTSIGEKGIEIHEKFSNAPAPAQGGNIIERIRSYLTNMMTYLRDLLTSGTDINNKIGLKIFNDTKHHSAAMTSDVIVFKDSSSSTDSFSYFGLTGAKTGSLLTNTAIIGDASDLSASTTIVGGTVLTNSVTCSGDVSVGGDVLCNGGLEASSLTLTSDGITPATIEADSVYFAEGKIDTIVSNSIQHGSGDIMTVGSIDFEDYDPLIEAYQHEVKASQTNNADFTQTIYGNIDMDVRPTIEWSSAKLTEFNSEIDSWGLDPDNLSGTTSSVMCMCREFDEKDVAFSPMTKVNGNAVLLHANTVTGYIEQLISGLGTGWTAEQLISADETGATYSGTHIDSLIADVGNTALATSQKIGYVGEYGSVNIARKKITNRPQDTYWNNDGKGCSFSGDVTSSTKYLRVSIPTGKSLEYVSDFKLHNLVFSPRGTSGYIGFKMANGTVPDDCIPNQSNGYKLTWTNIKNTTYMKVSFKKVGTHLLEMVIEDPYGYSNVTNNTPVSLFCELLQIEMT